MAPQIYRYHRTGDIIFCRDSGLVSWGLRKGQAILSKKDAPYSHVALCVSPGLIIQSSPKWGVHIIRIDEKHPEQISFHGGASGSFSILRSVSEPNDEWRMFSAILNWTGQKYNYRFLEKMAASLEQSYCSQLIVRILRDAGSLPASLGTRETATPSELFDACKQVFPDVTDQYAAYNTMLLEHAGEKDALSRTREIDLVKMAIEHNLRVVRTKELLAVTPVAIMAATDRMFRPQQIDSIFEGRNAKISETVEDMLWLLRQIDGSMLYGSLTRKLVRHYLERMSEQEAAKYRHPVSRIEEALRVVRGELDKARSDLGWLMDELTAGRIDFSRNEETVRLAGMCRRFFGERSGYHLSDHQRAFDLDSRRFMVRGENVLPEHRSLIDAAVATIECWTALDTMALQVGPRIDDIERKIKHGAAISL